MTRRACHTNHIPLAQRIHKEIRILIMMVLAASFVMTAPAQPSLAAVTSTTTTNKGTVTETLTDEQQNIVKAAKETPSPGGGLCAWWVQDVLERVGIKHGGGNACDMYNKWCTSDKKEDIRVGMIIAVSTYPSSGLGGIYGHVGIYIGNNTVRENIGFINESDLDTWISNYSGIVPPKWGWVGNRDLSSGKVSNSGGSDDDDEEEEKHYAGTYKGSTRGSVNFDAELFWSNAEGEGEEEEEEVGDGVVIGEDRDDPRFHFAQGGEPEWSPLPYYRAWNDYDTVATSGCGLCAFTSMVDILTNGDYNPATMLEKRGDWAGTEETIDSTVGSVDGSSHKDWTRKVFNIETETIPSTVESCRAALNDPNACLIIGPVGVNTLDKYGGVRWTNGHYICMYRCDSKGFYMHDSAFPGDQGTAIYYTDAQVAPVLESWNIATKYTSLAPKTKKKKGTRSSGSNSELVKKAETALGAGYLWSGYVWTGDPSTSAFTCSGLVDFAYGFPSNTNGPESYYGLVQEQGNLTMDTSKLKAGDLVFYSYAGRYPGHIGIYVGNGQIIDSIPGGVNYRPIDYMDFIGGGPYKP